MLARPRTSQRAMLPLPAGIFRMFNDVIGRSRLRACTRTQHAAMYMHRAADQSRAVMHTHMRARAHAHAHAHMYSMTARLWSPALGIVDLLQAMRQGLLPDVPDRFHCRTGGYIEPAIGKQYKTDREAFLRTARAWTQEHAQPSIAEQYQDWSRSKIQTMPYTYA